MPAPPCRARPSPLRRRSRHSACPLTADRAARRPEQRAWPRRLASLRAQVCRARRSPLRRRSGPSACSPTADRPTHQPGQRRTRPANLFTAATYPRRGATFPRLSGATSGNATVDAAVIAIRSPGGAAALPICCRSTTCCQSPRAVDRSRPTWFFAALLITECATATDRLLRRSLRCSASSALLARHSTALADSSCRWPGGDTRAGRCRCAHARRCRGLPSTISCRFRRSHASAGRIRVWWQRWQQTPKRAAPDAAGAVLSTWRECTRVRYAAMPSGRPCVYYCQLTFSQGLRSGPPNSSTITSYDFPRARS